MKSVNDNAVFLHALWHGMSGWPAWVWLFFAIVGTLKIREFLRARRR